MPKKKKVSSKTVTLSTADKNHLRRIMKKVRAIKNQKRK